MTLAASFFSCAQASVIQDYAANGALLETAVYGSYAGATTTDHVYGSTGMSAIGHADPTSPGLPVSGPAVVDPGAPIAPASGTGSIDARMETNFQFGAPLGAGTYDTFSFLSNLTASALSARNSAGEAANAAVNSMGRLDFYLDPFFAGVAPDTVVGTAVLGSLRSMATYEFAQVDIFQDSALIASLLPGDAGLSVSLLAGHGYGLQLSHALNVPYGIDPSVSLVVSGSLHASDVPEPSVLLLIALGGIMTITTRAQCRRASRP